jgi:hypothetical protein
MLDKLFKGSTQGNASTAWPIKDLKEYFWNNITRVLTQLDMALELDVLKAKKNKSELCTKTFNIEQRLHCAVSRWIWIDREQSKRGVAYQVFPRFGSVQHSNSGKSKKVAKKILTTAWYELCVQSLGFLFKLGFISVRLIARSCWFMLATLRWTLTKPKCLRKFGKYLKYPLNFLKNLSYLFLYIFLSEMPLILP